MSKSTIAVAPSFERSWLEGWESTTMKRRLANRSGEWFRIRARLVGQGFIAFSELVYSEASLLSRRDHQGAPTFE
jgi:hypothetical protein